MFERDFWWHIDETGAIEDTDTILQLSRDAIASGVNFLKTSTGKCAPGATLDACASSLLDDLLNVLGYESTVGTTDGGRETDAY